LKPPPSSHALVVRVRSLSAAIITPASPGPSSRPTSAPDRSRKSRRRLPFHLLPGFPAAVPPVARLPDLARARLHLARPSLPPPSFPRPFSAPSFIARSSASTAFAASTDRVTCGSLRRLPIHVRAAVSCNLAVARRPAGFASSSSSRFADLPAIFRPDRPWAPALQRLLPARRRKTLSSLAVLHAVSHLAVPRLRGFQPSCGCVLQSRRCSRRCRVAPLLVVSPLRG
jgi:hypothetical protein